MRAVMWAFGFLVLNIVALRVLVWSNKRKSARAPSPPARLLRQPILKGTLAAENILGWEHEYIRNTASEAIQDRHTVLNIYLVLVGVVISGVLANLDKLTQRGATLLLWAVCGVGWCHFLILVRLRVAWHESMLAMADIRNFCVQHAQDFSPDVLAKAFRWRRETIPRAYQPWSVFHYSVLIIGLLDSLAFGVGGYLLSVEWKTVTLPTSIALILLSAVLFGYHLWVYSALLKHD